MILTERENYKHTSEESETKPFGLRMVAVLAREGNGLHF